MSLARVEEKEEEEEEEEGEGEEDGYNEIGFSSKRVTKRRETGISKLGGRQSAIILKFTMEAC